MSYWSDMYNNNKIFGEKREMNLKEMKLGVVIGRFQTYALTKGHKKLIDTALEENDAVLILVGDSGINPNENDPLSVIHRMDIIRDSYKTEPILIASLPSFLYCDKKWSNQVDKIIKDLRNILNRNVPV